jgi:septum formation protein
MLVLASNSPRRKQLLSLGGWAFTVIPAVLDEQQLEGENPQEYVLRMAAAKARAVAGQAPPNAVIIAADTTVVESGEILGKPSDAAEAEAMLRRLRGRTHQVHTALVLFRPEDGRLLSEVCSSDVTMRDYADEEMRVYIASGDPFDKAGAYAIQHITFNPVENLAGCYTNVVGLPLCRLMQMLPRMGFLQTSHLPFACLDVQQKKCSLQMECSITPKILSEPL